MRSGRERGWTSRRLRRVSDPLQYHPDMDPQGANVVFVPSMRWFVPERGEQKGADT